MNTYNKYFKSLTLDGRNGVRRVEFRYTANRVICTIELGRWYPDMTQGRVSFKGEAPRDKPLEAFGIAIDTLQKAVS